MKGPSAGLRLLLWLGFGHLLWLTRSKQAKPVDERLDALADVGQAILRAQLKLDALCEVVYEQASQLLDTSNFQLGLFEDDGHYAIKIWMRHGVRQPGQRFPDAAHEGLVGWVRRSGQSLLVGDYEAEWDLLPARPRYAADRPIQPARSGLFAPLVAGGNTIGVMVVQSDRPNAFNEDDLHLLTVLTNQAAGAIHNAQLFEEMQSRTQQMRLVSEVSRQITAVQPLGDLFRQIVTLIHDTFNYYAVNIFLLDEKHRLLRMGASSHPNFSGHTLALELDEGLIGWAATNGLTALAMDVNEDERYIHRAGFDDTRAEVAVPLVIEGRVLGILDVQSNLPDDFTRDDVTILEALAAQVAIAIQESQNYDAERRQRERLNTLAEASRAVVSILNIDELLEEVVDLVTDYFGYDRTHVFLREGDRIVFRAGSGVHSGRWAIEQLSYGLNDHGIITEVARNGQPIISNRVADDPRYIAGPGVEDTQAEVTVPIRIGRHILGVLDIQSLEAESFLTEDVEMAQALADTIAIALRNANLYAREKRRRILAETLREVSTVLGASLEVDNVLNGILQGLERVIVVNGAIITLFDEDEEAYRVSAVRGNVDSLHLGTVIGPEENMAMVLTGIFHKEHPSEGEAQARLPLEHDHLVIPLMLGDDCIGYLGVDHQDAGRFSLDDIEILNAFATQAAIAIANAQLYMAQREEAWISNALLQVAEATARAATLDEVLGTVAHITPLLVGVQWCAVLLLEQGGFRVIDIAGAVPEVSNALVNLTVPPSLWPPLETILHSKSALLLEQQGVPIPGVDQDYLIEKGVILPLHVRGEVLGALVIGQQDSTELLSHRKIELIGGIANQAAIAIETAQLYVAQQEEAWVTTAVFQVAEAVNAQVDLSRTLETVVRLTPMLVGVERCAVMNWDPETRCFSGSAIYGVPPEKDRLFAQVTLYADESPYAALLSEGAEPQACGDNTEHTMPAVLAEFFPVDTILGIPLAAQGHLKGMMLVDHPPAGAVFDQRRMNILLGIASQTGLALETSALQEAVAERRRLERELELAKDIQTSFLPDSAPAIPGWSVASYYRPARRVGGDFYDFIPLRVDRWGLVVADVADKGVPAALYMALSRTLIRAVGRNRQNPATALMRVNELLLADSHSDLFVTVWYGIWKPSDGTLTYTSAGHNTPFVLRRGRRQDPLKVKGIALGVVDGIKLKAQKTRLEPGDVLVLYTDGVTEARSPDGSEFGLDGLMQAADAAQGHDADAIIGAIVGALDEHSQDEPQFDDLTLVVLCRDAIDSNEVD